MKEGKSKIEFEQCAQIIRGKIADYDPAKGFTKYDEKTLSSFETREGRHIAINDENFVFAHFTAFQNAQQEIFKPALIGYVTIGGVLYGNKLYYGLSICSPKDKFSKKTGRTMVKSRLRFFRPNRNTKYSLAEVMTLPDNVIDNTPALVLKMAVCQYIKDNNQDLPNWRLKSKIQ